MNVMRPIRAKRTYTQQLNAPPGQVFPLLCPVREVEWVTDWNPLAVYSHSGVAETDCVFITRDSAAEAVWVITRHDPVNHVVEFVKITPGFTAVRISIVLEERLSGGTEAVISYMYTALSEEGEDIVNQFTEAAYETFMKTWETALNAYLLQQKKSPGSVSGPEGT
ncbi:MAG: hypothetical protein ACE5G0_22430 [Rhodothermales bacterium]